MRIVDVCAFYTPHGGGVKTYAERKLRVAAAQGHEMIVLAPGAEDHVEERAPDALLATIRAPLLAFDRRYRYFGDEAAVHRALDRWRPDFVEASSPWSSASMVARWRGSAPRALVMHADPLSAYAYRWFGGITSIATIDRGFDRYWRHLRQLDKAFDLVVSASENLSRRLRNGGLAKVATIPMGVEPGIFSPARRDARVRSELLARCGLGDDATLLIGVGRYSPEKRWSMVIDAAIAAGSRAPVGLLLIGEGRQRDRLIARAGGSPHVIIAPPVRDRDRLATIMASADALVHGCEAETFCMVAAEAKASGLRLIVPDRGGAADHAIAPVDLSYRAADGGALRDAILAAVTSGSAIGRWGAPREMDAHFRDLFSAYGALTGGMSAAA
ncbi:MAG TPA: glycosyltransferase [Sphingomonas sp.]